MGIQTLPQLLSFLIRHYTSQTLFSKRARKDAHVFASSAYSVLSKNRFHLDYVCGGLKNSRIKVLMVLEYLDSYLLQKCQNAIAMFVVEKAKISKRCPRAALEP
jgi:hypothetical protein